MECFGHDECGSPFGCGLERVDELRSGLMNWNSDDGRKGQDLVVGACSPACDVDLNGATVVVWSEVHLLERIENLFHAWTLFSLFTPFYPLEPSIGFV